MTVIHCKGHQQGTDAISKGNWLADQAAKEAATPPIPRVGPKSVFEVLLAPELPLSPRYTEEDQQTRNEGGIKEKEGWWKLPDQRLSVPRNITIQLVKHHHETTQEKLRWRVYRAAAFSPQLPTLRAQIRARSDLCAKQRQPRIWLSEYQWIFTVNPGLHH